MANYDQRAPQDYRFGQLAAGITSLDTTLTSTAFSSLPSDLSTTKYVPITLADDALGVYETVWAVGHTAGSTAVTVVRGKEGSTARAWSQGAVWRCAPTVRDTLPSLTRATLPTDAHIGMRAQLADEATSVTRTADGWAVPAGGTATGRRHSWMQNDASLGHNSSATVGGFTPNADNGTIVTKINTTDFTLNRPGLWSLRAGMWGDWGAGVMRADVLLEWPSGPFRPRDWFQQTGWSEGGFISSGRLSVWANWVGYATAAEAALPLRVKVYQVNNAGAAVTGWTYYLSAEYLGG